MFAKFESIAIAVVTIVVSLSVYNFVVDVLLARVFEPLNVLSGL